MNKQTAKNLEKARAATAKKFGEKAAVIGNDRYDLNVVPTPSVMLDYKLGRGGVPKGALTEVFGSNGLGKTSALGYGILAAAQRQEELVCIIAMEPNFDQDWAYKLHGLDPEMLLVVRPDNAQEAFEMLYDLVFTTDIDYIMLDSIGAMGNQSSQKDGGKKKAFGVSGDVTSGLNDIMPRLHKSDKGLLVINQQRQAGSFNGNILYESPGGEALKHHALVRIQLKPGSNKYNSMIDGQKVLVGRELKCVFKKNKMAQAANKSAEFDFYHIETEQYGVIGVDKVKDYIDTGMVAGVIHKDAGHYHHPAFPDGKVHGFPKARKFFSENPEVYDIIRQDILRVMVENELAAAKMPTTEEDTDGD